MIQRMSDQHKIKFLDNETSVKKNAESEDVIEKTLNQIAEEQKSKKLSCKDDGLMTSQHISSARTGKISDTGGPSKYVKSDSSNTIWDSEKNVKEFLKIDSKTKTIQEKTQISSNKREAEKKRMDDLSKKLKSTIQDFMRVADKTDGEKVSEDIQIRKNQVDDSWRGGKKSRTSTDIKNKLFDGLFS